MPFERRSSLESNQSKKGQSNQAPRVITVGNPWGSLFPGYGQKADSKRLQRRGTSLLVRLPLYLSSSPRSVVEGDGNLSVATSPTSPNEVKIKSDICVIEIVITNVLVK